MLILLIETLNATPDAVRMLLFDLAPALWEPIRAAGCIVFEDGSVSC